MRLLFGDDELYTHVLLSATVVDRANETAGCWTVDIQIRPEPMAGYVAGKLRPKQRLVVILWGSIRTNGLLSSSVSH